MADKDGNLDAKDYGIGISVPNPVYPLKGSNNYDWGMKDRLSRVFNPVSGKTVMLAFDHGYLMGPSSGLERIDLSILPIVIAGGKKVPEAQALEIAYQAVDQGACGVDMGRNVFQAENPMKIIIKPHGEKGNTHAN